MEKEQEMERERDKARSTKLFDAKLSFNEPPPKVRLPVKSCHCKTECSTLLK